MKKHFLLLLLIPVIGLLVWVYYHLNPAAQNSFFPACPTYKFLGIYCPGCGSQRAVHYLLHGQVGKAFRYNPLFVVLLPLSFVLVFQYAFEQLTGRRFRIKLLENSTFLKLLFAVVCVYFVARNLPFQNFEILRPPNYPL